MLSYYQYLFLYACSVSESYLPHTHFFFCVVQKSLHQIVNAFSEQRFGAGDVIIQQGAEVTPDEPGLYMLEQGECAAYKNDTKVYTYKEAGELLILHLRHKFLVYWHVERSVLSSYNLNTIFNFT